MKISDLPLRLPIPFANTGSRAAIPVTSQIGIGDSARASLPDGFPPVTRQELAAGGVPPYGIDFNGIFYEISAISRWENAGGFYPYDSTFSTAIGGYPKGSVVLNSTSDGYWQSLIDDNTDNPEISGGSANWIAINKKPVATFSALSSTPAILNQIITLRCHTSGTVGGGQFIGVSGSVTNDGGTQINSATTGIYWQRLNLYEVDPYMFGATGVAAADTTAIAAAIAALKSNGRGGTLTIPSTISKTATVPTLNLSNSYSVQIIDRRLDVSTQFGQEVRYIEGRDASGGYATEFRIKGKQQPSLSLQSLSDGTAFGYRPGIVNNMTGINMFKANGDSIFQLLTDPFSCGAIGDIGFLQYAAGTSSPQFGMYFGVDGNNKTRIDISPAQLIQTTAITISAITNTTPITITTSAPHGIAATVCYITISGATPTGLNGAWRVSNTGASTLVLLGSNALGALVTPGTMSYQANAQRASLVVPKPQSGTEAIAIEGTLVSLLTGAAPILTQSKMVDANLHARPYLMSGNGTQQVSGTPGAGGTQMVSDIAQLAGGTKTITLTGSAPFTGSGTYIVLCTNISNANAVKVVNFSGSQFTITGTGTDQINWLAIGY